VTDEADEADGADQLEEVLGAAYRHAVSFRRGIGERPAYPPTPIEELRHAASGPLPETGEDPIVVVDRLAALGRLGSVGSSGPRYFGYVIGGTSPAAAGADWLVTAWDQNAAVYSSGPAVSMVEEVCARWLVDIFGLPARTSVGFTTGAQMSTFTGLAAARHHLLARAGWDVERKGLSGAPRIRVLAGDERHASVDRALRFLGLGTDALVPLECDANGAMRADALASALEDGTAGDGGPGRRGGQLTIVCAQAGNINTGAVDPIARVCDLGRRAGAWVHVDGAIGLWAAASSRHRHLLAGAERADSWSVDGHKWLNAPYDCGIALCAHPDDHAAAMSVTASYIAVSHHRGSDRRDQINWNPEWSRRARSVPVYAALASLGRAGVGQLVERNIAHAQRIAARLAVEPGIEVLNEVVLNQVLVRFLADDGRSDQMTTDVIHRVQEDGVCWVGGTNWRGHAAMRISICGHNTTTSDVDRSADSMLEAFRQLRARRLAAPHPSP